MIEGVYTAEFDYSNEKLVIKGESGCELVKGLKKCKYYEIVIMGGYINGSGTRSYVDICDNFKQKFDGLSNEKKTSPTTTDSNPSNSKPSAPKNVKAKKVSAGKAKISWDKVSGADGYAVYMASSKNGDYSKIKTISKASTVNMTKSKLTKGKTYYFKVRAYKVVDGKKVYSKYSSVKSVKV